MRKFAVLFASLILVMAMAGTAMATPVPSGTVLFISPGLVTGGGDADLVSGSAFQLGDGVWFGNPDGWTALLPGTDGGLIVGSTQPKKAIVAQWTYFNSPGHNYTSAAVTADESGFLAY